MQIAGDTCSHHAAHFAAEAVESNRPFYPRRAQSTNSFGAGRSRPAVVKVVNLSSGRQPAPVPGQGLATRF